MGSRDRKFVVLDTENTGLERLQTGLLNTPTALKIRGSEVCQIGGLVLDEQMVPIRLFCLYCDTVAADSSLVAYNVHGIAQRDVRRYLAGQFLPEVMTVYLPELFDPNIIFIGYNIEYDMSMIAQTLSNSPVDWIWRRLVSSIIPRTGRWSIDVAEYVKMRGAYLRLSTFEKKLETARNQFFDIISTSMRIDTNCPELLAPSLKRAHSAFYDAVNTYLLWGEKVWKKKLV